MVGVVAVIAFAVIAFAVVAFVGVDSCVAVGSCVADVDCRVVALDEHANATSHESASEARLPTSNDRAPEVTRAAYRARTNFESASRGATYAAGVRRLAIFALLGSVGVLALPACYRVQTLRRQAAKLDRYVEIEGHVERPEGAEGPLVVELLRVARMNGAEPDARTHRMDAIVERAVKAEPGRFRFVVRPSSRYALVAFVDTDRDLQLDAGELWAPPVAVPSNVSSSNTSSSNTSSSDTSSSDTSSSNASSSNASSSDARGDRSAPIVLRPDTVAEVPRSDALLARQYDLGGVVSLDDPRFGPESGEYGIWQPLRWPQRFPMGVFFVEAWDPTRVPVLFVYGIGGYPQQLRRFAELLDGTRYQAWFVSYPTGLPIAMVSDWLRRALDELHAQLGFERLCLVAHSMGGLVARDLLGSYDDEGYVRGLTTIATPFEGLGSAAFGVSWSPAVAPAWRDLAPGSELLTHLFDRPGPRDAQRDLVFLFEPGTDGDGVVPLRSQLRAEAQAETEHRMGFALQHSAALQSRDVWDFVAAGLERCAPPPPEVEVVDVTVPVEEAP
jgi:pimeloyl-ACP methyl ester carboxylesterase